ncbi:MAG: tRNA 2-thiouridine(34) synthase MnmA [Desulfovibrionaceae bacterium]|nr:tRNA 2-thiouridine(34) synthase MnmA [Desulfovibrionaceae bacterium]
MTASPHKARALVGLSGGVDSSVAALLLLEQGYAVTGVTMSVYDGPAGSGSRKGCYDCGEGEDIAFAVALAGLLGIPHQIFDCSGPYRELVLDYFRETYLAGQTPNPCVRCNPLLKFGVLPSLARAAGLEHEYFATGHYARVERDPESGLYRLRRGQDQRKDQSYFLYRLNQEQLGRTLFPLGNMRKEEVRALAAGRGLPMHDAPDSQDFYSGEHAKLLNLEDRPGDIVDAAGRTLGRHRGFWHFTPGQRKGLALAAPAPLYVIGVDAERNQVRVGPYAQSLSRACLVGDICLPVPGELEHPGLTVRLRSSQPPALARALWEPDGKRLRVDFAQPQSGVAPGQSLVFYLENLLVGGGVIREAVE